MNSYQYYEYYATRAYGIIPMGGGGAVEPGNVQKPQMMQTTTFVQTFCPLICKQPHLCKHFAFKCASNHICANTAPSNVQIFKIHQPANVQT